MAELNPDELTVAERYKLLIGSIVPRPIGFVSTVSPGGALNLAPYSFFNGVGSDPMMVLFCPANKNDGHEKDSLRNARPEGEGGVGQFVINVASEPYITRVAAAAEPLEHGVSEFELVGLTPEGSSVVRPPRVAESPVSFECETDRIISTNPGAPAGGNVVMGRVVHVRVRDDLLNERRHVDQAGLAAVGRMGGLQYCRTRERFELPPNSGALDHRPFG